MQIPLFNGGFTEIDEADYGLVSAYRWRRFDDRKKRNTSYAGRYVTTPNGQEIVFLHRLLMNPQTGMVVDHKNGDGLCNVRGNLRVCTKSQNRANGKTWKVNSTGYRGVYPKSNGMGYFSCITNGPHSTRSLGSFQSNEDAARAYDKAAFEKWGEFARLNFPCTEL